MLANADHLIHANGALSAMTLKLPFFIIGLVLATGALACAQNVESSTPTAPTNTADQSAPPGLLARYLFNGDAKDATRQNFKFRTQYTQFIDNALYLFDGVQEGGQIAGSRPYDARCEIPQLDYQRFSVALRIKPEAFWFHNRNLLSGGKWNRWFGLHYGDEVLHVTFNNHSFEREIKNAKLEIGKWSVLACSVDIPGHTVTVVVNGGKPETVTLPADFALDVLIDKNNVREKMFTFIDHSNASNFRGFVDEFLVYGRALNAEELAKVPLAAPDVTTALPRPSDF